MNCGCKNGYYNNSYLTRQHLTFSSCWAIDLNLLDKLKEKVICEYQKLLRALEKGHRLDYEFILQEISLINLIEEGQMSLQKARFYLEFYINNEFNARWRTY